MTGILPDRPNPQPPAALGTWLNFIIKRKRSGRPRKLYLFPKALLYQIRHGGTLEAAYEALATERAQDLDTVKRQVARERKWARKIERLEQAREQARKLGGILGK